MYSRVEHEKSFITSGPVVAYVLPDIQAEPQEHVFKSEIRLKTPKSRNLGSARRSRAWNATQKYIFRRKICFDVS